jgi:hypothetical protein
MGKQHGVGFEVLMAEVTKISTIWHVAGLISCMAYSSNPEDGGDIFV